MSVVSSMEDRGTEGAGADFLHVSNGSILADFSVVCELHSKQFQKALKLIDAHVVGGWDAWSRGEE